jgi:glycogen operon protein
MTSDNWRDPNAQCSCTTAPDDPDIAEDGTPLIDDDLLLLVNSWWEPL